MNVIDIESETLHLPELKTMLGKDVRIVVLEDERVAAKPKRKKSVKKAKKGWFTCNFGRGAPDGMGEGFEEELRKWRERGKPREIPE